MGVIFGIPRERALDSSLDRGRRQPRDAFHRRLAGGNKPRKILPQIFASLWYNSLKGVRILLFNVAVTSLPQPRLKTCSTPNCQRELIRSCTWNLEGVPEPRDEPYATGPSDRAKVHTLGSQQHAVAWESCDAKFAFGSVPW